MCAVPRGCLQMFHPFCILPGEGIFLRVQTPATGFSANGQMCSFLPFCLSAVLGFLLLCFLPCRPVVCRGRGCLQPQLPAVDAGTPALPVDS